MSQTGFQLFLGHGGHLCPTKNNRSMEHDLFGTAEPLAMDDNEWEDIDQDDIPPEFGHLPTPIT